MAKQKVLNAVHGKHGRKTAPHVTDVLHKRDGTKPACAIIGCNRPVRSKGYCAAHYQKFNVLRNSNRLPPGWKADAKPHSVKDVVLPRGRASGSGGKTKHRHRVIPLGGEDGALSLSVQSFLKALIQDPAAKSLNAETRRTFANVVSTLL